MRLKKQPDGSYTISITFHPSTEEIRIVHLAEIDIERADISRNRLSEDGRQHGRSAFIDTNALRAAPPDLKAKAISTTERQAKEDADRLLSRREAAEYLGVSPETLAVWHCNRRYGLPLFKVGRLAKYRKGDLDKFVQSRKIEGKLEF